MALREKLGLAIVAEGLTSLVGSGLVDVIEYGFGPHFYLNNVTNNYSEILYSLGFCSVILGSILLSPFSTEIDRVKE